MTLPANGNAPLNNPSHFDEHVSLPRGIVAWKMGTGTVAFTSTAEVEVIRLTNVPLSAGRLYVLTGYIRAFSQAVNGHMAFRTPSAGLIAGTSLRVDALGSTVAGTFGQVVVTVPFTVTTTGTFTIPMNVLGVGTGTAYMDIGSNIRVEDIGPVRGAQ